MGFPSIPLQTTTNDNQGFGRMFVETKKIGEVKQMTHLLVMQKHLQKTPLGLFLMVFGPRSSRGACGSTPTNTRVFNEDYVP